MKEGDELRNRFIVLEGIDGAGKTSIGNYLQQKYGFVYVETPGKEYETMKSYMGKRDPYTRLAFYFAGNLDASSKIKNLLKTNTVVCDRYFYSTLAYFSLYTGETPQAAYQMTKGLLKRILKPDIIFLLQLDNEVKKVRLHEKMIDYSDSEFTDKFLYEDVTRAIKVENLYMEYLEHLAGGKSSYYTVDSSRELRFTNQLIDSILKKEKII